MHEAWTIVSAVSAVTERVEIGTLVLCTSFRSPGLVAKMAVSADDVSDGRLMLGLGAGWHDAEYEAFGYPKDHRVDRFEEAVGIIAPLLRGETVSFGGGGTSMRTMRSLLRRLADGSRSSSPGKDPRMLRFAARHADAWNTAWYGAPDERLRGQLTALAEAIRAEGRDPTTMTGP